MKKILITLLLAALIMLPACKRKEPLPSNSVLYPIVTGITVQYHNDGIFATRKYFTDEKMQHVLNYLRWIDPYGDPEEDPETAEGSLFSIALTYSDGNRVIYHQKSDRYMRSGDGPWKCIKPDKAMELGRLLGSIPSDTDQ